MQSLLRKKIHRMSRVGYDAVTISFVQRASGRCRNGAEDWYNADRDMAEVVIDKRIDAGMTRFIVWELKQARTPPDQTAVQTTKYLAEVAEINGTQRDKVIVEM